MKSLDRPACGHVCWGIRSAGRSTASYASAVMIGYIHYTHYPDLKSGHFPNDTESGYKPINSTGAVSSYSVLVTSSPIRPTHRTSSPGCRECRACRATSPFSLPRAYLIGRPAVCCMRCSAARLSVCRCHSPNSTSPTRTTCCGHSRDHVTTMTGGRWLQGNCSVEFTLSSTDFYTTD